MNFEYTSYILPLLAAAIISSFVVVYAWTRRKAPGVLGLLILSFAIVEWTVGYSLEIA